MRALSTFTFFSGLILILIALSAPACGGAQETATVSSAQRVECGRASDACLARCRQVRDTASQGACNSACMRELHGCQHARGE